MADKRIPGIQKFIAVLWPSFLTAVVASGLFFSAFDPDDLFPFDADPGISRLGIYTIGFLLFWLIAAVSAVGTLYFAITNCLRNNPDTRER
jgi:hypothetical protein